jgi:hypothetical protein
VKAKGQKIRSHAKFACPVCPPMDGENAGIRKHKRILRRRDRHIDKRNWTKEVES